MTSLNDMRRELQEKYEKLKKGEDSCGGLTPEEIEVCTDILKKLGETKQIYIVDLDYPISITKGLFRLLDAMRRVRAEKMGLPEEQFDMESYIAFMIGLP